MNSDEPTPDYSRPVAYDVDGRPLYAHPPEEKASQPPQPQVVHMARPSEPMKQEVSESVKTKHDESVRAYPTLNLSESEYVITAVRRHPIGLFLPVGLGIILSALSLSVLLNYDIIAELLHLTGSAANVSSVVIPISLFILLILLGTYVAYYVYVNNQFFLTNESVIQEIQLSLFTRREQTASLGNIEDASFRQSGILQNILNYGSIRLSTEGNETTYRFNYVSQPKKNIAILNNAVEAFKNGRPIED